MSARQQDILRNIEYPESDGNPMAETDKHRKLMNALIETLEAHFIEEPEVYVSGNLMCYYVEGDPTKSVSPDVFLVRGIAKQARRTYKFWEEKVPNLVIEVSSRKTKNEDLQWKKQLYAWLGVNEYFIFDPEYKMNPPLRAFRLHGKELIEEVVSNNRVVSEELGLELVNDGTTLRLFNPQTNEFLRTPSEEVARAGRLAAKLRELGLDPNNL
jgi:Uma2 family endonuclease